MANSELSLMALSQIALSSGMHLGFNAAGVERWIDPDTFEPRIAITFGDQVQMRKPRLRTPCEWALSYSEEMACIRESRTIEVPFSALYEASYDFDKRFTEALLEIQ